MKGTSNSQLSISKIQDEVAKFYHIQLKDLKGKTCQNNCCSATNRYVLAREMTESSLPKIGAEFGGKDHTTVIHAHEKISQLMKSDSNIQQEIAEIKNLLLG